MGDALNDGSHAAQVRVCGAANPSGMLLTPATPPPHVASPHSTPGHGHMRGRSGSAAGMYPNVVVTGDMLKTHKIKLAKKPTPAPAPHDPDVFSTTSTH